MSRDALLLENNKLRAQLDEREVAATTRDAMLVDRDAKIEQLADQLRVLEAHLKRLLAGRGGAQLLVEGQGILFPAEQLPGQETPEHANEAPDGETAEDKVKRHHRPKRPAKKVDTSALAVEERRHELSEQERTCPDTGLRLVPVGEKVFEEIEFQRSKLFLVRHTQVIYGLSSEDAQDRQVKPVTSPLPARPLEGCAASANLLAQILVQKYANHLPLYRQEGIFERDGLRLPRQTMCDWVLRAADVLRPVADFIMEGVRSGEIMQLDDTPVICQGGKGHGKFQAYLWTFVNPEMEGVAYRFTTGRASDLIKDEIGDFAGYLVGDGYSGNKAAARKVVEARKGEGKIVIAGCWAHTTRKFRDALEEVPGTAQLFRDDIKRLYEIEQEATEAELDPKARCALRREKSRPILASLLRRARRIREQYSDAGLMAKALGYMLNQHKPLRRFLEDGRVPIDNNRCERSIRPIAIGRRNWLFAGSVRGGQAAAVIYTLIECCRLAKIDMADYLSDVLVRITTHPASEIAELVPARWTATVAASSATTDASAHGQWAQG